MSTKRREFLASVLGAGGWLMLSPQLSIAATPVADYRRLLILVELKGGNDGLNTLVPFASEAYYQLRPKIAIARDTVLPLNEGVGLHPACEPVMGLWQAGELAVLQGVGYPAPNLSHFRSIEIWNTASKSDEVKTEGWLSRAFSVAPPPAAFVADGVMVGQGEMGPLAGTRTRAIALTNIEQFLRQSRLAQPAGTQEKSALAHIRRVESDITNASARLGGAVSLATEFPKGAFGEALKTACSVVATGGGVAAIRVTLNGFDTHQGQNPRHANLLGQLASGLAALKSALVELGRWNETLVMTYSEFGRRARENQSGGTDHGTASVHFALGGRVRGGLYGAMPDLAALDANDNLAHRLDFRAVYGSVLERWWGVSAKAVLGGRFEDVGFLRV